MASKTLEFSVTLTSIDCCVCGATYAINERFRRDCQEDGRRWHCPYCQADIGYNESENARLKRQLAQEQQKHDQTQAALRQARDRKAAAERRENAAKGQVTKLKKRAAGGVCPCCRRTFQALARHMQTKHPDFAAETPEAKP